MANKCAILRTVVSAVVSFSLATGGVPAYAAESDTIAIDEETASLAGAIQESELADSNEQVDLEAVPEESLEEEASDVGDETPAPAQEVVEGQTVGEDVVPAENADSSKDDAKATDSTAKLGLTAQSEGTEASLPVSGTCGTCAWSISASGTFTLKPKSGSAGTLVSTPETYFDEGWPWATYTAQVKKVVVKGTVRCGEGAVGLFQDMSNAKTMDLRGLDTSSTKWFVCMFNNCSSVEMLDLSTFDTSRLERMDFMFMNCSSLRSLDLSTFDLTRLKWFSSSGRIILFDGCTSLSTFKIGKLYDMSKGGVDHFEDLPGCVPYSSRSDKKWWSYKAQRWFTALEIYQTRSMVADTYTATPRYKISKATVAKVAAKTYTGKAIKPSPKVTLGGKTLARGTDYKLSYANNKDAGTATITITGIGKYSGKRTVKFTIRKAAQPMKVKAVKRTAKASVTKKGAVTVAKPLKFTKKAQGKVTYARVAKGSDKCLAVSKKTGKVTVMQGTKKGTYKVKIKVTAAGNKNYKSGSKTITCTVVVK